MRRIYRPFVHHYVALSRDLAGYLQHRVGVPPRRIIEICNGVDTDRFRPRAGRPAIGMPVYRPDRGWSAPSAACRP